MNSSNFKIKLPTDFNSLNTSEEYFILVQNGREERLRLHDYDKMYRIPGLYEKLMADTLKCASPEVVSTSLAKAVTQAGESVSDLVVLEVGAGVGMMGESLKEVGIEEIYGVDIVQEAADLAERDRPGLFQDYFVEDVCQLSDQSRATLDQAGVNALVCVSALNVTHIPTNAFIHGFNLVADDGWIAFNINKLFLEQDEPTGYSKLINRIMAEGILDVKIKQPYQHRLYVDGRPLYYVVIVGQKKADIPERLA